MGILLLYDVTNLESFNHITYWLQNIEEVCWKIIRILHNFIDIVERIPSCNHSIGWKQMWITRQNCWHWKWTKGKHKNKQQKINENFQIAEHFDLTHFEVSCKDNVNIEASFMSLARKIREKREQKVSFSLNISSNHFFNRDIR